MKKIISDSIFFTSRNETMRLYLNEVRAIKMLDESQLNKLHIRAFRGDERAVNEIVRQNLRLVISVAKRFEYASTLNLEDCINEGNIGLIFAAKKFDPRKGTKFSVIATMMIRQHIIDAIRAYGRTISIPKHWESEDEAKAYDTKCKSGDAPAFVDGEGNEISLLELLAGDMVSDDLADKMDAKVIISNILMGIRRQKDREIVCKSFGIGYDHEHTNYELALEYGCTEEAIRQLRLRVLFEMAKIATDLGYN